MFFKLIFNILLLKIESHAILIIQMYYYYYYTPELFTLKTESSVSILD